MATGAAALSLFVGDGCSVGVTDLAGDDVAVSVSAAVAVAAVAPAAEGSFSAVAAVGGLPKFGTNSIAFTLSVENLAPRSD